MKRMAWMAVAVALLLGVHNASAQTLGDVARANRKGKLQRASDKHYYDNDNIPTTEHLSVVGPAPSTAPGETPAATAQAGMPATDAKTQAADRAKAADEWKQKLDEAKQKVDAASHDLDLVQREYRVRSSENYSDVGNRLRNSAQWDKDSADFKKQVEDKQKAVDSAKQDLENLQEEARKAGAPRNARE